MDHNEYIQKLQHLEDCNSANLIALGTWVRNDALPWLWNELGGAILTPKQKHPNAQTAPTPRKLTPMAAADAVRQGLMVSVTDRATKLADPFFYRAQLTMLDAEASRYCSSIDAFSQASTVSVSTGKFSMSFRKASRPPAEAPIATTLGFSTLFAHFVGGCFCSHVSQINRIYRLEPFCVTAAFS